LRLVIAGDGEQRSELEQLALNLSVDARFTGQVGAAERDHLLSLADIVVIPSRVLPCGRTEGMPIACLEAMAAGRVVIASRVGGLAETIVDGHNGLLVEPGDHRTLAQAILRATSDCDLCERISAGARAAAARYHWSRLGPKFSRIIKSCIENNDSIVYDQACKAAGAD
jgi:glycosyltransferase involved in cell wall biosynthesis